MDFKICPSVLVGAFLLVHSVLSSLSMEPTFLIIYCVTVVLKQIYVFYVSATWTLLIFLKTFWLYVCFNWIL